MKKSIELALQYPHLLGNFLGETKLSLIHSLWIKKYWLNNQDYILLAHRNSYKTTAVIIIGYIWYSLIYPDKPVLLIREETTNARAALRKISTLLQSDKMQYIYKQIFGINDFKLTKDTADSIVLPTKKKVTMEGSLDVVGIGTSVTGRHYSKLIFDDFVTVNDRISKAKRDKKKLYIQEYESIKTVDGISSYSDTPWHYDDALVMLENRGVLTEKYPIFSIGIDGFNQKKADDLRTRMTRSMFDAQYLLKHTAEESQPFNDIKFCEWEYDFPCYAQIDPAYSGTNTTALTILQYYQDRIIVRGWIWRQDISGIYDDIAEKIKKFNPKELWVENNADKGASEREFRKRYYNIRGYHESQNKLMRIIDNAKKNWLEIYFANDCNMEYVNQISDWSENEDVDDAVDSLASCIKYTEKKKINNSLGSIVFNEIKYDFPD